jgi:hypothetical protein
MKIENLKEGMKIKNYKALCDVLGEKTRTGNSKISQIDNWKKYFEFKKEKNSYIILEIYDTPKITSYLEKVELLLLDLMAKSENSNYTIFSPKTALLQNLNIINSNYKLCKKHNEDFASFIDMELDAVYEFFQSVNSSATYQLEKVLKRLENRLLISYNTVDMICCLEDIDITEEDKETINEIIYEYGDNAPEIIDKRFGKKEVYRMATPEEVEYSLEIKKKVLEDLQCTTGKDAIAKGVYHVFVERCREIFKERDINFFYKAYEIIFHKPNINIKLQDLVQQYKLSEEKYNKLKQETNIEHIDNILHNANNRVDKAIKDKKEIQLDEILMFNYTKEEISQRLHISKYSIDAMLLRSDENYINNMEKLTEILIKNNAEYIIPELSKYIIKRKQNNKLKPRRDDE